MDQFLYTLLIVFIVLALSFLLMNIGQIFTGREFRGTCATNNPMLKNQIGECTVCGSKTGEACQNPDEQSGKLAGSV